MPGVSAPKSTSVKGKVTRNVVLYTVTPFLILTPRRNPHPGPNLPSRHHHLVVVIAAVVVFSSSNSFPWPLPLPIFLSLPLPLSHPTSSPSSCFIPSTTTTTNRPILRQTTTPPTPLPEMCTKPTTATQPPLAQPPLAQALLIQPPAGPPPSSSHTAALPSTRTRECGHRSPSLFLLPGEPPSRGLCNIIPATIPSPHPASISRRIPRRAVLAGVGGPSAVSRSR